MFVRFGQKCFSIPMARHCCYHWQSKTSRNPNCHQRNWSCWRLCIPGSLCNLSCCSVVCMELFFTSYISPSTLRSAGEGGLPSACRDVVKVSLPSWKGQHGKSLIWCVLFQLLTNSLKSGERMMGSLKRQYLAINWWVRGGYWSLEYEFTFPHPEVSILA